MKDLIGLVYNSKLREARELVDTLVNSLELRDRCWISSAGAVAGEDSRLKDTSLVLVVGGDGTILRTVRVTAPHLVPIVGVNMGRVGFMTELTVEDAVDKLPLYFNGNMRVEERMMLAASVMPAASDTPRTTLHALNDVVVDRRSHGRLQEVATTVDGAPLTTYRADAVIVSTSTGSTGYALSAGGPIMYPETEAILVQPVAAHTGLRDGLILQASSVVELTPSDIERAILVVDGLTGAPLSPGDRIRVERSSHVARFLRAESPSSFYSTLTQRLGLVYRFEQMEGP